MIAKDRDSKCVSADRNIVIAVDGSENAGRAVLYVSALLGGLPGFCVTLLNIISEPPADYFSDKAEREKWIEEQGEKAENMMKGYRKILWDAGFPEDAVSAVSALQDCPSIAECILAHLKELKASTVVVGRRGITRKEEFLFGSTSSKILHETKDCSVWVIK